MKGKKINFRHWWNPGLLLSPWAILIAIGLGIFIGIYWENFAIFVGPFGIIYLTFLEMCILPIILSAVASSIGQFLKSQKGNLYYKSIIVIFLLILFSSSVVGLLAGLVGQPGTGISEQSQDFLGDFIINSKYAPDLVMSFYSTGTTSAKQTIIYEFFNNIIPKNIFYSLSNNITLHVLFFAIVLGVGIAYIPEKNSENLLILFHSIYQVFLKIIKWAMYILPFGLFCLIGYQITKITLELFSAMVKYILLIYVCCLLIFIINTIIIWFRSGKTLIEVMLALKSTILIAIASGNSLIAMPAAITSLHERLKFEKEATDLLIPISITICRYGNVLFFAIATMFIAQLYNISLGLGQFIIAIFGCVMAGMATSGTSGVITLQMILIVLQPLKLPLEAVLPLFIAIDPMVGWTRALINVHTSCAATAIIAPKLDL